MVEGVAALRPVDREQRDRPAVVQVDHGATVVRPVERRPGPYAPIVLFRPLEQPRRTTDATCLRCSAQRRRCASSSAPPRAAATTSESEEDIVDQLSETLQDGGEGFDEETADCFAEIVVDEVGRRGAAGRRPVGRRAARGAAGRDRRRGDRAPARSATSRAPAADPSAHRRGARPMSDNAAGWQPDPTGKHDHRYWDGTQWTDNVADAGVAEHRPLRGAGRRPPTPDGRRRRARRAAPRTPTVVTPVAADDTTPYPAAAAPPPPYVPPTPAADGGGERRREQARPGHRRRASSRPSPSRSSPSSPSAATTTDADTDRWRRRPGRRRVDDDTTTSTEAAATSGERRPVEDLEDACADGDFSGLRRPLLLGRPRLRARGVRQHLRRHRRAAGRARARPPTAARTRLDTDGLSDGDLEEIIADTYEETFGLSEEQAECLAEQDRRGRSRTASSTEEQAMTRGLRLPRRTATSPWRRSAAN